MSHGKPRDAGARRRAVAAALRAAAAAAVVAMAAAPAAAQVSLFDPRLDEVRRASVAWDNRGGPRREVVDLVCLVPDLATFLEVVSTWDLGHFFPVLLDDVEYSLKFLRAFRPARVVRYPGRAGGLDPASTWPRAVAAVGASWRPVTGKGDAAKAPPGDAPPAGLGPTPPGVVASYPESPTLAAAVALAAGRFQPLLRWETAKRSADALTLDEARGLAKRLEALVAETLPKYDRLGDDCDFVTLAGDYPYSYDNGGPCAFDDLVLRPENSPRRWAFAGRVAGDPTRGVYAAMCALFLHPSSALLLNTYSQKDRPWVEYTMDGVPARLSPFMKVTSRAGEAASLSGWHKAFDPVNPFGLVLINSQGAPTQFGIDGGPGQTSDVPESSPTAVHIIHSFSAASPADPQTLAGRWLANGAFVYYGSMNEPYLQSFRPPELLGSLLAENLPLVASFRKGQAELGGQAWRLVYFGDPLYRLRPVGKPSARLGDWGPVAAWPAYSEFLQPAQDDADSMKLKWALRTAIFLTQTGVAPRQRVDLAATLLQTDRGRLDEAMRALFDDLLVDTLLQAKRPADLTARLGKVPPAERSAAVRRHLETAQTALLQRAADGKNTRQAMSLWAEAVRAPGSADFVKTFTERVGKLCEESPVRLAEWRDRLDAVLRARPDPANVKTIKDELERVTARVGSVKGR